MEAVGGEFCALRGTQSAESMQERLHAAPDSGKGSGVGQPPQRGKESGVFEPSEISSQSALQPSLPELHSIHVQVLTSKRSRRQPCRRSPWRAFLTYI